MLENVLIPIIAILCTIALPIGFGLYTIIKIATQKHTEKMELIKQGIVPSTSPQDSIPNSLRALRNGMLCIGVALGLVIGILVTNHMEIKQSSVIICGLVLLFLGIAYVIYYVLSKDKINSENEAE